MAAARGRRNCLVHRIVTIATGARIITMVTQCLKLTVGTLWACWADSEKGEEPRHRCFPATLAGVAASLLPRVLFAGGCGLDSLQRTEIDTGARSIPSALLTQAPAGEEPSAQRRCYPMGRAPGVLGLRAPGCWVTGAQGWGREGLLLRHLPPCHSHRDLCTTDTQGQRDPYTRAGVGLCCEREGDRGLSCTPLSCSGPHIHSASLLRTDLLFLPTGLQ